MTELIFVCKSRSCTRKRLAPVKFLSATPGPVSGDSVRGRGMCFAGAMDGRARRSEIGPKTAACMTVRYW